MLNGYLTVQPFYNAEGDVGGGSGVSAPVADAGNTPQSTQSTPESGQETGSPQPTNQPVNEIEIDGFGKVKIDDLKEWKNGYMRQSDYTKKTQELSRSKQEMKEAMEVYTYLKNNPQVAQSFSQGDYSAMQNNPLFQSANPYTSQLQEMNMKLATFELDGMITGLKTKYQDFNEVEVLTEADRLGISDLEFVYNSLQGKKLPTLKEQLRKEIEQSLIQQFKQNGTDTETIINPTNPSSAVSGSHGLSEIEMKIAYSMGIKPEEYAKNKLKT